MFHFRCQILTDRLASSIQNVSHIVETTMKRPIFVITNQYDLSIPTFEEEPVIECVNRGSFPNRNSTNKIQFRTYTSTNVQLHELAHGRIQAETE